MKSTLVFTFLIRIKLDKKHKNMTGKLSQLIKDSHGCFINKKRSNSSAFRKIYCP